MFSQVLEGYRLPQPHSCPDEFYALMTRCWASHATDRPQFSAIITSILDPLVLESKLYTPSDQEGKVARPLAPLPLEEVKVTDKKGTCKKTVRVKELNYFSIASKVVTPYH